MTGRTVLIGVGNPWRGDDGAGLAATRAAATRLPSAVEVRELDGEPARLVGAWTGATLAVVVDAVRSGSPPGTVHRWEGVAAPLGAQAVGEAPAGAEPDEPRDPAGPSGRGGDGPDGEPARAPSPIGDPPSTWAPSGGSHALGLAAAVALGRAVGDLPGRLVVYGIEGTEFGEGEGLSAPVAAAAAGLAARLVAELGGDDRRGAHCTPTRPDGMGPSALRDREGSRCARGSSSG